MFTRSVRGEAETILQTKQRDRSRNGVFLQSHNTVIFIQKTPQWAGFKTLLLIKRSDVVEI